MPTNLLATIALLLSELAFRILAQQIPFSAGSPPDWSTRPRDDETAHLIFNAASSWLQHWPNVRWRNGHAVVLGHITPGTLLYHGSLEPEAVPPTPEWVSFDFEHSYMFGSHMRTFAVKPSGRGLRVLYFDGNSAANMPYGSIDTQELVIDGRLKPGRWKDELGLMFSLCEWGRDYGIQGFVRMEYDFEVMICDFADGLDDLGSIAHVAADWDGFESNGPACMEVDDSIASPTYEDRREDGVQPSALSLGHALHPTRRSHFNNGARTATVDHPQIPKPFSRHVLGLEAIQAGQPHAHFPGVPGVELDYSAFVTFYDPKFTSLRHSRRAVGRRESYRAGNATSVDVDEWRRDLEEILRKDYETTARSGVRWGTILLSIKKRYAERLNYLSHILAGSQDEGTSARKTLMRARDYLLVLLSPHLEAKPAAKTLEVWLQGPMRHCSLVYTAHLPDDVLTHSEQLLKRSVEGTLKEMCRVLGEALIDVFDAESLLDPQAASVARECKNRLEGLKQWLGWVEWIGCEPGCGPDGMCTLPQWPLEMGRGDERADACIDNYKPMCLDRASPFVHWVPWEKRGMNRFT